METQNSFDLNRACVQWRQDLVQHGVTPAEANELESHLHEAMADLQRRGLNGEEAFWIARHRLGPALDLADQFAKANSVRVWRDRLFWSAALMLAWLLWMQIGGLSLTWVRRLGASAGFSVTWNYLASQIVTLLPLPVVAVLLARGKLPKVWTGLARPFGTRHQFAAAAVVVAACMLVVHGFILSQWHAPPGQHAAAIDLLGSLLAYAVWPVTLVLVMLSLAPKLEEPAA